MAKKSHLNVWDNYIQVMLQDNEQLAAKADYLEFKNKKLMEALKAEKKKEIGVKGGIYLVKKMMVHSYFLF